MIDRAKAKRTASLFLGRRGFPTNDAQMSAFLDALQQAPDDERHLDQLAQIFLVDGSDCPDISDIWREARATSRKTNGSHDAEYAVHFARQRRAQRDAAIETAIAVYPELGPLRRGTGRCRCGYERRGCRVDAADKVVLVETCEVCGHAGYLTEQATATALARRGPQREEESAPAAAKAEAV